MKLNIGCGETKLEGYVNIDLEESTKPDLVLDVRKDVLPFNDNEIEEIVCIHNIEHIEFKYWDHIFQEFNRVLLKDGLLLLAYPEFERCAKYFIENHRGLRDFWRATLYGRQLYPGDYHVTPMVTEELISFLTNSGFGEFKYKPEVDEEYNTFLIAKKTKIMMREDVIRQDLFVGSV